MELGSAEQNILADIARRLDLVLGDLVEAIEGESAADLAAAMCISLSDAEARLARVRRAVAIGDDWGAGCKLLTDDVRQELQSALRALADADHSASPGVSQG